MINMGVESFLIGAALNMVLAQRLLRRICPKCRTAYDPPRPMRKAIERMGFEIDSFFKGTGCKNCRNTGYRGRIGIHELLLVNDEIRDSIVAGHSVARLRESAIRNGMVSLQRDGFRKVREGITTIEEVLHAAGDIKDVEAAHDASSGQKSASALAPTSIS
jgi:type IV pilus assembly protein PilB